MRKCLRPNCDRRASRQSLCHQHYALVPRGYVPAEPIRAHVKALREKGYGLRELAAVTGLSEPSLLCTHDNVQLATAKAILAVPIPAGIIDGGARISSVGTVRRLQSLVAFGYAQSHIAEEMGLPDPKHVSVVMRSEWVFASTAARVAEVYDRLQMTPGTHHRSRIRGRKAGWVSPWCWDEGAIDDPDAQPLIGDRNASFNERYWELRDLGIGDQEIAQRFGIKEKSLQRQMRRYDIERGVAS